MSPAENDNNPKSVPEKSSETPKSLSHAARRALEEAAAMRAAEGAADLPTDYSGRGRADTSRFDDWEINGRAIDF